jgi:putative Mg2+ transporter-C (MgtC) family protein
VVAALGMGIADHAYMMVACSFVVIMAALLLLSKLERVIDRFNQSHTYRIVSEYKEDLLKEYEDLLDECSLRYKRMKRTKQGENIIGTWIVSGSEKNHNKFTKQILHHSSVKEFEF